MFRLIKLKPNHPMLSAVEALYLDAFPPEERRPVALMRQLHRSRHEFQIEAIIDENDIFLGFVSTWRLGELTFIDHFAVEPIQRGRGIGAWVLKELQQRHPCSLILEVEYPETPLAQRRIEFYQRLGFRLWREVPYLQPSYAEGTAFVPMYLMTYGNIDVELRQAELSSLLHREVYGLDEKAPKGG